MYDIDSMIQAADIESMLVEMGMEPERRKNKNGYELYFHCFNPDHDDTKRKMSMAEQGQYKGLFYCWSCKFRGNIIQIIQHFLGLGFQQALVWMKEKTGVGELMGTQSLIYKVKKEKLNYGVRENEETLPVYDFEQHRQNAPPTGFNKYASDYLTRRGINKGTRRKFQVSTCLHKQIGACISVPIIFRGQCCSAFFCQPKDGGLKRYPKGAPQGQILFNYDECVKYDRYVMVESVLDVLMLDSLQLGPAMACFTNMVSDQQIELLKPFSRHAVFPDRDSPRGWDLVTRMVTGLDKSVQLILPPDGKDPGDCHPWEIVDSYAQSQNYSDWESECYMSSTVHPVGNVIGLKKK